LPQHDGAARIVANDVERVLAVGRSAAIKVRIKKLEARE
jgi:hypothetical protein